MTTTALQEAIGWHDSLMDAEYKGRKDNESAARFRLSKKIGVPESYLFRLTYKRRDMRDVAGEVYRRLKLAHDAYENLCARVEASADAMRDRRLNLKEQENADAQGPVALAAGVVAAVEIELKDSD